MKKKKTANLIMVLIIAAIAIAGVVTAFMLKTSTGDGLGSQYQIRELKDNAVITPRSGGSCLHNHHRLRHHSGQHQ